MIEIKLLRDKAITFVVPRPKCERGVISKALDNLFYLFFYERTKVIVIWIMSTPQREILPYHDTVFVAVVIEKIPG